MASSLKEYRIKRGLSSTELAHRLGISQSTYVRSEQSEAAGSISLNTLSRAAAALHCALKYELVPLEKTKGKNQYLGLRRSTRQKSQRSQLQREMKAQELEVARHMSEEERLLRACELSDFSAALK